MATQDELKRIAAEKRWNLFLKTNTSVSVPALPSTFFIEALGKSGKKIKGAVSTSKKIQRAFGKIRNSRSFTE